MADDVDVDEIPPDQIGLAPDEAEKAAAAALAEAGAAKGEIIPIGPRGIEPTHARQLIGMARVLVQSGLAPKNLNTPQKIVVVAATGMEAGLSFFQSLRALYVVNGLPAWQGDGMMAVIRNKAGAALRYFDARYEGLPARGTLLKDWPDDARCIVTVERAGYPRRDFEFSVADARQQGLWMKKSRDGKKDTPWITTPKRMLYYRALGLSKDLWQDVLMGLPLVQEARDWSREDLESAAVAQRSVAQRVRTPPPVDPLLDKVAPPSKQEQKQRAARTAEQLQAARVELEAEVRRRTAPDEAAAKDLLNEITGGKGVKALVDAAAIQAAAEALDAHQVFGGQQQRKLPTE